MKRLILGVVVLGVVLVGINVFALEVKLYEEGYGYEIIGEIPFGSHTIIGGADNDMAVDNERNVYFRPQIMSGATTHSNQLWKMDIYGDTSLFAEFIDLEFPEYRQLQFFSFCGNTGEMYCGMFCGAAGGRRMYIIKITGFTPLSELPTIQDLKAQIDDLKRQVNPELQIISPADGSTVSGLVNVDVFTNNEAGLSGCYFYVDNKYIGYDRTAPFSMDWNSTYFSNGSHTIKVIGNFKNGVYASKTTSITVTTNNPAVITPSISITSPKEGDTVSGTINITTNPTAGFGTVYLYVNGKYRGYDAAEPFEFSYNTTALPNGTHYLRVSGYHLQTQKYIDSASIAVNVSN